MINDLEELKDFMQWCAVNGLRNVQIGDVKFELSDYALTKHLLDLEQAQSAPLKDTESTSNSSKTMADTAAEDEEILFWSSKS